MANTSKPNLKKLFSPTKLAVVAAALMAHSALRGECPPSHITPGFGANCSYYNQKYCFGYDPLFGNPYSWCCPFNCLCGYVYNGSGGSIIVSCISDI